MSGPTLPPTPYSVWHCWQVLANTARPSDRSGRRRGAVSFLFHWAMSLSAIGRRAADDAPHLGDALVERLVAEIAQLAHDLGRHVAGRHLLRRDGFHQRLAVDGPRGQRVQGVAFLVRREASRMRQDHVRASSDRRRRPGRGGRRRAAPCRRRVCAARARVPCRARRAAQPARPGATADPRLVEASSCASGARPSASPKTTASERASERSSASFACNRPCSSFTPVQSAGLATRRRPFRPASMLRRIIFCSNWPRTGSRQQGHERLQALDLSGRCDAPHQKLADERYSQLAYIGPTEVRSVLSRPGYEISKSSDGFDGVPVHQRQVGVRRVLARCQRTSLRANDACRSRCRAARCAAEAR